MVFAALDAVSPRAPSEYVFPPPMLLRVEAAVSERPWRDWLNAKLGLRLWVDLVKSESITPGPIDFRGAFDTALAVLLPDTGGYALCLRFRMLAGALGGSMAPGTPVIVEDVVFWRVDALCRRNNESERTGRVPVGARVVRGSRPSLGAVIIVSNFGPVTGATNGL